jgi:hypothetical protein
MGEGGCWQAGGLVGWPADPSSQPFTQEGERGVEVGGAQLGKTSTPDKGAAVYCTVPLSVQSDIYIFRFWTNPVCWTYSSRIKLDTG